jgi:hypothetical protein
VVLVGGGVAGGGDDADFDVAAEEVEQARDDRAGGFEALAVVVEGDVAVEGGELEGARGGGDGHDLGRVEDQADVVEGRGDEATRRDVAPRVLVFEGGFEREAGEEGPDGGDEELEFGGEGVVGVVLVGD